MCRLLPPSVILAALCLLAPSPQARAQGAPPPSAPTLAQALTQAEPPRGEVYLAVGAEKVTLPAGSSFPPPGVTVPQVADSFGRIVQAWETAAAVAPPTMTALNVGPGTPSPYAGMSPADAFEMLTGSLDDGQWGLLTGGRGIGYADLTEGRQRDLFTAMFPGGTLTIRPQDDLGSQYARRLTAGDLQQARLRLSQQTDLSLQVAGAAQTHMGMDPDDGRNPYTSLQDSSSPTGGTASDAQRRATVPNAPKPSDLDAAALTVLVPLAGVKTVGELIGRIGTTTRMELYADVRYEARTVTVIGPASARAGDLLRALALCVCGTYRKVGPAYVLTDDVLGLEKRRAILARFSAEAILARAEALSDAGDKWIARGAVLALPPTVPGLEVTGAQKAAWGDSPFWNPLSPIPQNVLPFGQLTPAQQDLARRGLRRYEDKQRRDPAGSRTETLTLSGTIMLQLHSILQLLSPAVPGPVTLNTDISMGMSFQPSAKVRRQLEEQRQAREARVQQAASPAATYVPTPLATLLAPFPRRAVLARPRTAKEVDALIESMRRGGLNQLWLDVFSQGKSHLDAKPSDGKPDILTEALARTKGTGIAVIPALDLLCWGQDAPEAVQDRTALGETAAQDAAFSRRYGFITTAGMTAAEADAQPPSEDITACPAVPAVAERMTALVRRLAGTPGVAVLALRDTAAPGYVPGSLYGSELGYTLPLRLACLRRTHVDPVDLGVPAPLTGTSLSEFEADAGPAIQGAGKQWDALRADADLALMRRLLVSAQASAGRPLAFLVEQRGMAYSADWWGLWDNPRTPLPVLTLQASQQASQTGSLGGQSDFSSYAHTQSRVVIAAPPDWARDSSFSLVSALSMLKPGWDGIVIDDTVPLDAASGDTGTPLTALLKRLTPPAAATPISP